MAYRSLGFLNGNNGIYKMVRRLFVLLKTLDVWPSSLRLWHLTNNTIWTNYNDLTSRRHCRWWIGLGNYPHIGRTLPNLRHCICVDVTSGCSYLKITATHYFFYSFLATEQCAPSCHLGNVDPMNLMVLTCNEHSWSNTYQLITFFETTPGDRKTIYHLVI